MTATTTPAKIVRRCQSIEGIFRMQAWVKAHRQEVEDTRMTYIEAARRMSVEFGEGDVSPFSVKRVAEACGFDWPTKRGGEPTISISLGAFRSLVGAVTQLYHEIDLPLPSDLAGINKQLGGEGRDGASLFTGGSGE